MSAPDHQDAAAEKRRRLYVYNGGFLTQKRIRRILDLAGYDIALGKPGPEDAIGIWGHSPTAPRGEAVARHTDAPVIRVEDTFLRSVLTGRDGAAPLGLNIDPHGVHFDPATRSGLERLLSEHPLDDTALLGRARDGIAFLQRHLLSKYNAFDTTLPPPDPGYVLVIDQTRKDASVAASGADLNTFRAMLYYAQEEHPRARILIKTHPETAAGHREGYFTAADETDRIRLLDAAHAPQTLFEGAIAVYTISSQMGFEAILSGHRPVVFGQPFYAGWGLSDDRKPLDRRQRRLTRNQLFAAAMFLYPTWYDPHCDRLCSFEDAARALQAETRAWRDDHRGWVASGMRLWKRPHLQSFFGRHRKMIFADPEKAAGKARETGRDLMIWASRRGDVEPHGTAGVEDGFRRSRGLGAELVPPLSLVLDRQGIYYDATRPSDLEALIAKSAGTLTPQDRLRAQTLTAAIREAGLSKYNLAGAPLPDLPPGRRILVPGQVEDDASILRGTTGIATNRALLDAVKAANPAAILIYKPHPDVTAGLRPGALDAGEIADIVLTDTSAPAAIDAADEVWTMTSLLGFEALLRDRPVTCLGMPFYAGWGLTTDRTMPQPRRAARPDLIELVHAALIDYPRYHDPVTNLPCPVEIAVTRLASGETGRRGPTNRILAKLQGLLASYAPLWRR